MRAQAFEIPTDKPEADGTIAWNSTTLVLVEISGGGETGLGYTYSGASIVELIGGKLASADRRVTTLSIRRPHGSTMQRAVRNLGREGLAATAISAVDAAIYDLKARLLGLPLFAMLGSYRDSACRSTAAAASRPIRTGSLQDQLGGWVANERLRLRQDEGRLTSRTRIRGRVKAAKQAIGDRPFCSSTPTALIACSRRSNLAH